MVTVMTKQNVKYTAQTMCEQMLKLVAPDAKRTKFLVAFDAMRKEAAEQAEGAYAKAMRLATEAGSMDVFLAGYELYKTQVRSIQGTTIDKSVTVAFSAISTAWFDLSKHCGKTITGTVRGKHVQMDVPSEARDIPASFKTFSALRSAGRIARAYSEGKTSGGSERDTEKAAEASRALSPEVAGQLLVLTERLREMEQKAAEALLAEAIAKALVPSITPKKAVAKKTTEKTTEARKRATKKATPAQAVAS